MYSFSSSFESYTRFFRRAYYTATLILILILILILCRTLSGLGAGALTLMITALSSLSSSETRTSAISQFFVAAALGEIAGPLLAYATASVSFDLHLFGHVILVNQLNCVGLWTLLLFTLSFVFVCRSIDASAKSGDGPEEPLSLHLFQPRLIMIFTLALFVNMGVSSWETVVTPLAQLHFRWGVESNSLIFILSGAILFFSNIVLVRIATLCKISDEVGTFVSIVVATAGAVLLLLHGNDLVSFVIGNLLFTLGIFCPLTFVTSMYTKNIVARPSLFIGAFRASSAGIRVVGNLLAAYSLSFSGHAASGPNVAFCDPHSHHNGTDPVASSPSPSSASNQAIFLDHSIDRSMHSSSSSSSSSSSRGMMEVSRWDQVVGGQVDSTGPELLLLSICGCALIVSFVIYCTKPKKNSRSISSASAASDYD